ncbi:MAG: restriction endonuclease subunit S [Pontiellaceae bacterium]|nr:restriction endonuclease subunit S [Pontiellaceae bacterium]MBN2786600.1 restriction endonuclease subunit S [Pontiellaceae bacterium]
MSDFPLPNGWEIISTQDSFTQIPTTGKKVKTKECLLEGAFPVIDQGQSDIAGYVNDPEKLIRPEKPVVIFGDHTRIFKWVDTPFVPGADGTKVLSSLNGLDSRFFYHQMTSLEFPDKGYSRHFKYLIDTQFSVPPLAEQKEIAARLDDLLAQVDSIKTRLDGLPAILKRFRQSVLAAATSGKLTQEWASADDHFYDEVDGEIKADAKLRKLNNLGRDEIELSTALHGDVKWERWKLYPLEKLVDSVKGIPYGIVQTGQHTKGGVPTVRCGDVKSLVIDASDLKLVQKEISDSYKRTLLSGGEVLLAIRGTVGNAAVAPLSLADCNISREVALIPVREKINAQFIALLLQSPGGYRCLAEKVRGVAQRGINLADIKRFVVPLPTLEEQTEIVRRVEELFTFTDQVEQRVKEAQAHVNHLTQSILAKAFRGELTEEWRAAHPDLITGENSAAALLEHIKFARANLKPRKKTPKKR